MHDRAIYSSDHELFRSNARRFFREELEPNIDQWEADGVLPRAFWEQAGALGFHCCGIPEKYGGPGADFLYNMVLSEEVGYAIGGASIGFSVSSDIVSYYLLHNGSEEQKAQWLPKMVTGESIAAIGMTEPGCGSDLKAVRTTAVREGDEYLINGQKTFITNGQNCDFVLLACSTDPAAGARGLSLILVESEREGFQRGRNLDKIGQKAADTSELFFADVRVPVSNLLGQEGGGFAVLMNELPRERITIACRAFAEAQRAYELTVEYVKERKAFGKQLFEFQNTQFKLAEIKTSLAVGWAYLDQCLGKIIEGKLTPEEGAMAKLWTTETGNKIVDECLQFFGGYGYMREYPISRLYMDARVRRIYGGSSEIMKLVIGRTV
ncbi:MAG: acyl-CoA dehydrogenase family protein [Gammaproteobacteria bacterium]|jgi:long-chain-acyl-CoA dehydrogenase|nr:acyl-CoA dehydrogenase [Gammaproteobacteria bacterium]MDP6096581.1 acyl-CoA dehydrogenase family protein [Gammaproteobacteria bacterium]MDP7455076.1 acyl-CoA dehydrogenase family protein [Gammaproteobacteria bacterium]HJO11598.1 acyl-CoA dehydrogenase family protein [Gammaproteobacteria bacterium]|tara:strand:+ start:1193 stop:2332 length:1140 start_codon:yes stop_codon:yes gene_type:complete